MTKAQVINVLKKIAQVYKNFECSEEKTEVWFEYLKDADYSLVQENLAKHIKANEYAPVIANLLEPREIKPLTWKEWKEQEAKEEEQRKMFR